MSTKYCILITSTLFAKVISRLHKERVGYLISQPHFNIKNNNIPFYPKYSENNFLDKKANQVFTLVNVYINLLVYIIFTRIACTS